MENILVKYGYVQDEQFSLLVGLTDDLDEPKHYVLFQKTKYPTQEDIALGHHQMHTTIGDQSCSGYGYLELVELFEDRLELTLSDVAKKDLSTNESKIILRFDARLENLDEVTRSLKVICEMQLIDHREYK